jgi:type II secretory pathway pseudopilin PulG
MDTFLLFGLIGFGCLILGILGYTTMTNKIIKEQEREIEALKAVNRTLNLRIKQYQKRKAQPFQIAKSSKPTFEDF